MTNRDRELHEEITQQVICLLEDGIIPWHISVAETPANLLTRRPYRGVNALLLAAWECTPNYFLTERQILRIGACVIPGQKPHIIVDGIGFRSMRLYEVYSLHQCQDVPKKLISRQKERDLPLDACKKLLSGLENCPRLIHEHECPYYDPERDVINMTPAEYAGSREEYFAAFFKQLIASTKHSRRLGWIDGLETCDDPQAFEELILEIGVWHLRSYTGIELRFPCREHHIQYWLCILKQNLLLIIVAADVAQQAFEYLVGMPFDLSEAIDYVEDEILQF